MSLESVVNQSLDLIGYKRHIGSIWDGSVAARAALNAYSETRDEVLALQPWDFARAYLPLVSSIVAPPLPWKYVYVRPLTAVDIRDVYPSNLTDANQLDPIPYRWAEIGSSARYIMTSFTPAAAIVTYRVTDTSLWPPEFTLLVVRGLAEKMHRALVGGKPSDSKEQPDGAGRHSQ
jgi:hypothetical protein